MNLIPVIVLISFILFYSEVFEEQEDNKVNSQLEALQHIYKIVGEQHNVTKEQMEENAESCLTQDHYKLTHPDIILEDVYCNRKWNDTMGLIYKKSCFAIGHHVGVEYEKARTKAMIERLFLPPEQRETFMASRCIFTINLNLHPGYDISAKSFIHEHLTAYQKKLIQKNASSQCLQDLNFAPVTFALSNKEECEKIFDLLTQKFLSNISNIPQYILKTDDHQGKGLHYIDNNFFSQISDVYKAGALCGALVDTNIIQELTQKPTLLRGHKMDFRIWVLIVQAQPLIMYVYEYTVIMACLEAYDPEKITLYNFNCNAGLAKDYWTQSRTGAIGTPFTLKEVHKGQTFKQWGNYFKKLGLVDSDDWWKTHLLPLVEQKITYFMKIVMKQVNSDQRLSGIFAIDAALDHDLNLKILDFNRTPEFFSITAGMTFVQNMLHVDTFKLLKLYLIQRYKRLIHYMDNVMIPTMKLDQPINLKHLKQVLKIRPIPQKRIHRFFLIDQKQAVQNCKLFDKKL